MNATILRFGYPATLIEEYEHWVVLLRPAQPTLGSFVLAAKSEASAFPTCRRQRSPSCRTSSADIEDALAVAIDYEKINYLMLMMVDPHVHFHVIPRYEGERSACGVTVPTRAGPRRRSSAGGRSGPADRGAWRMAAGRNGLRLRLARPTRGERLRALEVRRKVDFRPFLALDRHGADVGAGLRQRVDRPQIPAAGPSGVRIIASTAR